MSDDVRDQIARLEGWVPPGEPVRNACGSPIRMGQWVKPNDNEETVEWGGYEGVGRNGPVWARHPIPDTLDEAAKLPEGWGGEQVFRMVNAPYRWCAKARRIGQTRWRYGPEDSDGEAELLDPHAWGDTEKEARFALRLAVLEHIAKETP